MHVVDSEERLCKSVFTILMVAFVSGVFKAGPEDDMKLIGRLFVRTGNTRSLSSDVLQHFGPLYSE